ncbi:MAG: ABC transporter permease [Betaproteobacteria bacterium RIFCSPLOWO2_12_FULL_67_28]|nr:MAG: ABC transporter permease [Betaproteobacteria bacterium RIFCSPLOWO2_02_FULL_68_150]OGA69236.1 MAG: ABC transporter permease [Betaproteobacteria bacterium RIFCSPLOWO2_12_FULL_67_28]
MERQPRALQVLLAIGLVALAAFPLVGEKFYLQFITKLMIMGIFAMSLDLLVGHTGLVSLGHALFFGVAAYALMLLTPEYQAAGFWTSLGVSLGVAALAALIVGFFVLRTTGIYFIMVTLAFGQMTYFYVHDSSHLGGSDGKYIYVRPVLEIAGWSPFDLERPAHFYYVALAMMVFVYLMLRVLLASPFGRVISGIKENEHRMRMLGFATFRYKLVCFVLAGTLAGLAGWLAAAHDGLVNPEMLSWHQSGQLLMMVILGGMGTPSGPILGAAALKVLELVFQGWTKHWQLLLGGFIVLSVLLLPRGLAQLFESKRRD